MKKTKQAKSKVAKLRDPRMEGINHPNQYHSFD